MNNPTYSIQAAAMAAGFYETGMVEISTLEFDPQIRKICEGNSCRGYNTSWACPPAVGTLEECRERCAQYSHMMLLTGRFEIQSSFDFQGMMDSMAGFKDLVDRLDERLKPMGFPYLLLSNEGCGRCSKCTWPDAPCRFPEKLHHSIEGYGFLVTRLAKQAGVRYNNGPNTITYFGAVLY